jgi:hypothetical protein
MRSYLDGYFNSLTTGQRELANSFVWSDRRHLAGLNLETSLSTFGKLVGVTSGSVVSRNDFSGLFSTATNNFNTIFDQANQIANIRDTLILQTEAKLNRIGSALKALEDEIERWEDSFSDKPHALEKIERSFGQAGLRPVVERSGNLVELFTVIQANAPVTVTGGLVSVDAPDTITENLFTADSGLQTRVTAYYVPGYVSRIRLDPITSIGDAVIREMRVYGANGELIATLINTDSPQKLDPMGLEYSIPKTLVSRIEIDLIDTTFNLVDVPVTTLKTVTGQYRIVIPAYTDSHLVDWNDVVTKILREGPEWQIGYGSLSQHLEPVYTNAYDGISSTGAYVERYFVHYASSRVVEVITTQTPVWDITYIPSQILLESYSYQEGQTVTEKRHRYEVGLANLTASNDFYTEVMRFSEEVELPTGMPSVVTLTTNEFLPAGSYINMFLRDRAGNVIALLPENREYTVDVLRFNQYGQAQLNFYPDGDTHFYMNADELVGNTFAISGKYILGPSANAGSINTMGNSNSYWAYYEPDLTRANIIPLSSAATTYVSEDGSLGENFDRIPPSRILTLKGTPFIDVDRIGEDGYSPVSVLIDGYSTTDLTNWRKTEEDDFPVATQYTNTTRNIHYKVRGNTIFFEDFVDRPVRVIYEYATQYVTIMIEMGVIHNNAACPVLYKYSLSYI